jgi:hypothetical protein
VLDAMRRHGCRNFIFSSTCATFGNPVYTPIDEKHPQSPINPYGRAKWMLEMILKDYLHAYGLQHVILRYFNACGASEDGVIGEDHNPETHLIPLVLSAIRGDIPHITVFGTDYDTPDGTCIRDYIHILDLADAHLKALDYLAAGGATTALNVGTGVGSSVLEVIAATERLSGVKVPVNHLPRRAGDPVSSFANASKGARGARMGSHAWPRRDHRQRVAVAPVAPQRVRHRRLNSQPGLPACVQSALSRWRSSQPSSTATRTRVVAQAVAGAVDQAQLSRPVALGQLAGIRGRHALVVVAVHHQQRARGEPAGRVDRAEAAELATPLVEVLREAGRADGTDLAGVFEEPPRLRGPVVEVGARAEQRGTAHPRVVGGHAGGDRATGVGADQPDARSGWSRRSGGRSLRAGRRPSPAARSRPRWCRSRGS